VARRSRRGDTIAFGRPDVDEQVLTVIDAADLAWR
jgi:hypothetical protein